MLQKPTRPAVAAVLEALRTTTRSKTPARTDFAIIAIHCLTNEGIEPSVTIGLPCGSFNLKQRWVEFVPWSAIDLVRRPLSDATASVVESQIRIRKLRAEDPVCVYAPRKNANRKASRTLGLYAAMWLGHELEQASIDKKRFSPKALKWIWSDENPDLREDEKRAAMLARFVLTRAKDFQQEALLKRIYTNIPVLRPSWAYPKWHKDVVSKTSDRISAHPIDAAPSLAVQ